MRYPRQPCQLCELIWGIADSWKDIPDEVDEFHLQKDQIGLGDEDDRNNRKGGRGGTRWRGREEEEDSDVEEVYALESSEEEDSDEEGGEVFSGSEDEYEEEEDTSALKTQRGALTRALSDDDDDDKSDEEDEVEGWGTSKSTYYGGDAIETEQDAIDEETEARRIQSKQLAGMAEEDFLLDMDDWNGSTAAATPGDTRAIGGKRGAITEALPTEIPANLPQQERLRLLRLRNPEFELLAREFVDLKPVYEGLVTEGESGGGGMVGLKAKALGAYLGVLAMYFALLSADDQGVGGAAVKEHGVMEGLVRCRKLWEKVRELGEVKEVVAVNGQGKIVDEDGDVEMDEVSEEEEAEEKEEEDSDSEAEFAPVPVRKSSPADTTQRKRVKLSPTVVSATAALKATRLAQIEANLSDLSSLLPSARPKTKTPPTIRPKPRTTTAESDFTDPKTLSTHDASEKRSRQKSLRFHASQLLAKSAKRANAGRGAGGDLDVPHKERHKDRADRLAASTAKHRAGAGDDLDDLDFGDDDHAAANAVSGKGKGKAVDKDLEYYNTIAAAAQTHKAQKKAAFNALQEAGKGAIVRIEEEGEVGPDGKRAIGYTIEKNKGLTPHRKKDVRNPRVKKRKAYEKAKIKARSMKATYKPLEGAYGGEATGIKKNLVKSVKLR